MATAPSKPARTVKGLRVVSKSPMGLFWRAGRSFTAKPTTLRLDELKKGQAQVLRDEPMLDVTDVDVEVDEQPAPAT